MKQARSLGDELHVFVDVGERNKASKGDKAMFSCEERCEMVDALKVVTEIHWYNGPDEAFDKRIKMLSSGLGRYVQHQIIFVKAGDYSFETLDKSQIEIIKKYEGIVALLDYDPQYSTTKIFDKIRKMKQNEK